MRYNQLGQQYQPWQPQAPIRQPPVYNQRQDAPNVGAQGQVKYCSHCVAFQLNWFFSLRYFRLVIQQVRLQKSPRRWVRSTPWADTLLAWPVRATRPPRRSSSRPDRTETSPRSSCSPSRQSPRRTWAALSTLWAKMCSDPMWLTLSHHWYAMFKIFRQTVRVKIGIINLLCNCQTMRKFENLDDMPIIWRYSINLFIYNFNFFRFEECNFRPSWWEILTRTRSKTR